MPGTHLPDPAHMSGQVRQVPEVCASAQSGGMVIRSVHGRPHAAVLAQPSQFDGSGRLRALHRVLTVA
jgi:hypothetical protein